MIQFLSPYGTLLVGGGRSPNGDFLPPDVFIGEPSFDYYNAERSAVSLFADHRFNEVWGVGGSLRYTASSVDYGAGLVGLRPFRHRPLPAGRADRPDGGTGRRREDCTVASPSS